MASPTGLRRPRWFLLFLLIDFAGLFLFLMGFQPGLFGLDRSPVMGYLQAIVFLIGLALIVVCTYALQTLLRPSGQLLTIREDIGVRLSATGYVLFAVSTTADLIGLGSHPLPGAPYLGVLQSTGLLISTAVILIGFVLYHPRKIKPVPPAG
jgi:hypothetical protein